MSKKRVDYDAKNKILRVYRGFSKPKTLVPTDELKEFTQVLKKGEDDQGRPVKSVRYVFSDKETAKYNQQPVDFAGLDAYLEVGGEEEPLGKGSSFTPREDFGIDGGE